MPYIAIPTVADKEVVEAVRIWENGVIEGEPRWQALIQPRWSQRGVRAAARICSCGPRGSWIGCDRNPAWRRRPAARGELPYSFKPKLADEGNPEIAGARCSDRGSP